MLRKDVSRRGILGSPFGDMNPMLLADWARIHRVFRALMWLVALVLACFVVTLASPHASGAPARPASPGAGRVAPPGRGTPTTAALHP